MNSVSYTRVLPSEHSLGPISKIPKLSANSCQTVSVARVTPIPHRFVVRFLRADEGFICIKLEMKDCCPKPKTMYRLVLQLPFPQKSNTLACVSALCEHSSYLPSPNAISHSVPIVRYDRFESLSFGVRIGSSDNGARGRSRADNPAEITGAEQRPSAIWDTHFVPWYNL